MPLLYFIWKDAGHSWRYGCLCTQFIHRFYRGPFGHLTRERTARRNGLEKAVMLFFHRPSPTKHVILSDSNTERRSYTPTTCHIHSKLPFSGFLGWMHTYSLLAFMDVSHSLSRYWHIVQHSHQENCTICDFQAEQEYCSLTRHLWPYDANLCGDRACRIHPLQHRPQQK